MRTMPFMKTLVLFCLLALPAIAKVVRKNEDDVGPSLGRVSM